MFADAFRHRTVWLSGRVANNQQMQSALQVLSDIEGIDHPKRMFDLTEAFIRRGYSDANITGILGGNWIRVLKESWAPVKRAKTDGE